MSESGTCSPGHPAGIDEAGAPSAPFVGEVPSDPIVVRDDRDLRDLLAHLLAPERAQAVIGLSASGDGQMPILAPGDVRAVVGDQARVYVIAGERHLQQLADELGAKLALCAEAARIWWPELTGCSEPGDHPLMLALEGESQSDTLAELARQFDLSRPHVRREIKLIEDCLALAEWNLAQAVQQNAKTAERLRDAHRERHREAARADAAERRAGRPAG